MKVSETFYSLQGEGVLVGVPSVFIRTAGCNLRCRWCDSKYAFLRAQGKEKSIASLVEEAFRHPTRYCVLTGGEPMLAAGIYALAQALVNGGRHVTIETAGTTAPRGIACSLASLSPKLSNSTPGQEVSADARRRHEARRLRPDALREWLTHYDCQLKFVVSSPADVGEVVAFLEKLDVRLAPEKVFLMPEGTDVASLGQVTDLLVATCKQYGFRFCDRLHIRLFGNRRGS